MKKEKSLKLLPWTKGDFAKVLIVYIANFILLSALFVGFIIFNGKFGGGTEGQTFTEYIKNPYKFFNFLTLLILLIIITAVYFAFDSRNFLKVASNSEMLFLIVEVSLAICFFSGRYISYYIRPFALVAILTLFLSDRRTALFMNFIYCVIVFLFDAFSGIITNLSDYSIVFFLEMGMASGVVAIYSMKDIYSRFKLLLMGFFVSLPMVICVAIPMVGFVSDNFVKSLVSSLLSGPFTVAVFELLLPIFEILFKKVTCFKLAELTDHKAKFIRKMIEEAPGTFNHAIIVSNIAEACATAIGEDALLARTCAYYHDLGKLRRPEFFKENQGENSNPHDDLTPELSANIIRSHATDGYALAIKNRMPKEIADVCREHHGTLRILYFYGKAQKFTDGVVDISQYCYTGPKPQSKISAIVMIADGSEAIVRALKERTHETVLEAVKSIVSDRMKWGQFDECEITLNELNIIIQTIVNSLTGIYHTRIIYPKVSLEGLDIDKKENK